MKVKESDIRSIVKTALKSKHHLKVINEDKRTKLEDEIDKVWINPESELEDLRLNNMYKNATAAKELKSKNLKWAKLADSLKSSFFSNKNEFKRDKKRILNKIQRIDYITDLVINPPKKKEKIDKEGGANAAKQDKKTTAPKQKIQSKNKKPNPKKIKIKKIQKIIKAPSALRNEKDEYGGADGIWGEKTTEAWKKYFSDPKVIAKAVALHYIAFPNDVDPVSETKAINKKLIFKKSSLIKLIKESENTAPEKDIQITLKKLVDDGKDGIGNIAILLGYDANMTGILKMLNSIESAADQKVEVEQDFTDIEGYLEADATLKYYKYQGGVEVYEKDGNILSGDEAKSAFKAWKRWSPWSIDEDADEQLDSSWPEYLDLESSDLTLDDEREYNMYWKCDAKDGLGPFVVRYHRDGNKQEKYIIPERWESLSVPPKKGVSGERIYADSKEGPYVFGKEGMITDKHVSMYNKWFNTISSDDDDDIFAKINEAYKAAQNAAEIVWKTAFAEMNETFTDEKIVTKACSDSTKWIEKFSADINSIFDEFVFFPEEKLRKAGVIPDNDDFLRGSGYFEDLVYKTPEPLSVFRQICFQNTTAGFEKHLKGSMKKQNFLAYFKEYGGLESDKEINAATMFYDKMMEKEHSNTLYEVEKFV